MKLKMHLVIFIFLIALASLMSGCMGKDLGEELVSGRFPSWSPDGEKIVYCSGWVDNIYIINVDGSNKRKITNNTPRTNMGHWDPAWSPDGEKIAFIYGSSPTLRIGETHLYLINTDGTQQVQLSDISWDGSPSWSPDGKKIVFTKSGRLYVINADGTNIIKLRIGISPNISDLAWSPDGTKIAFIYTFGSRRDIYIMNHDGTNIVNLTHNSDNPYARGPSWTPDGSKIVFYGLL